MFSGNQRNQGQIKCLSLNSTRSGAIKPHQRVNSNVRRRSISSPKTFMAIETTRPFHCEEKLNHVIFARRLPAVPLRAARW
jgi:hypothetical protein